MVSGPSGESGLGQWEGKERRVGPGEGEGGVGRGKGWAAGSELGLGCFGLVFKFGVLGRVARVWVGLTCLSWVFPNFKPTQT